MGAFYGREKGVNLLANRPAKRGGEAGFMPIIALPNVDPIRGLLP
jgi:hypothetical protein